VKPGLLEHKVSKPLQGIFFLVWRHPPYVRELGLLEHEISKTLQGMNFFAVSQPRQCLARNSNNDAWAEIAPAIAMRLPSWETWAAGAQGLPHSARHEFLGGLAMPSLRRETWAAGARDLQTSNCAELSPAGCRRANSLCLGMVCETRASGAQGLQTSAKHFLFGLATPSLCQKTWATGARGIQNSARHVSFFFSAIATATAYKVWPADG